MTLKQLCYAHRYLALINLKIKDGIINSTIAKFMMGNEDEWRVSLKLMGSRLSFVSCKINLIFDQARQEMQVFVSPLFQIAFVKKKFYESRLFCQIEGEMPWVRG